MATDTLARNIRGVLLAPPPTTATARKRWLAARRAVLGASDVSTVLGMAPPAWGTSPLQVWLEKTDPDHVPDDPTEKMLWGLRLERPIVDEYRIRHAKAEGFYVAPSPGLLRSEEYPWLSATPDRVLLDRATKRTALGLLEVKTAAWNLEREWADGVPLHYQIQTQVQMLVTGLPWVDVIPLFGGNKMPEPLRVEADEVAQAQIVEITGAWWAAHVEAGVPPAPEIHDLERLPQVWPGDGSAATLRRSLVDRLLVRDRIKERIRDLERAADRVEVDVKVAMGNATTAWYQPQPVEGAVEAPAPIKVASWTRSPRKNFDQKRFQQDHPGLAGEYTTTGSTQRFTVHKSIHDTVEE